VNEGEIVVASNEELHAAPAQRQAAAGAVERPARCREAEKVGDRDVLIDHLWSAIEALPEPEP
jgi:hypothetical protein